MRRAAADGLGELRVALEFMRPADPRAALRALAAEPDGPSRFVRDARYIVPLIPNGWDTSVGPRGDALSVRVAQHMVLPNPNGWNTLPSPRWLS